jgi:hypothetical protein
MAQCSPARPMRIFIAVRWPVYRGLHGHGLISPGCRVSCRNSGRIWPRNFVGRIYSWYVEPGRLVFPDAMKEWVREKYGDIETQQIVRVTNNLTGESTLFNSIRARRPVLTPHAEEVRGIVRDALGREGAVCKPP